MADESKPFTVWHGLFLAEVLAVVIALAMTITPSKTGSDTGFAGQFFDDPTFFQEFFVNIVISNAMMILLSVGIAVWWWKTGPERSSGSDG